MVDIYMTWHYDHSDFIEFIHDNLLIDERDVTLNVFLPLYIEDFDEPIEISWISKYRCLTTALNAPQTNLIAHVLLKYTAMNSRSDPHANTTRKRLILFVENEPRQYEEIVSILKSMENIKENYEIGIFKMHYESYENEEVKYCIYDNERSSNSVGTDDYLREKIISSRNNNALLVSDDTSGQKTFQMKRNGPNHNCSRCKMNPNRKMKADGRGSYLANCTNGRNVLMTSQHERSANRFRTICNRCISHYQKNGCLVSDGNYAQPVHHLSRFDYEIEMNKPPENHCQYCLHDVRKVERNNDIEKDIWTNLKDCSCASGKNLYLCKSCLQERLGKNHVLNSDNDKLEYNRPKTLKMEDDKEWQRRMPDKRSESAPPSLPYNGVSWQNDQSDVENAVQEPQGRSSKHSYVSPPLPDIEIPANPASLSEEEISDEANEEVQQKISQEKSVIFELKGLETLESKPDLNFANIVWKTAPEVANQQTSESENVGENEEEKPLRKVHHISDDSLELNPETDLNKDYDKSARTTSLDEFVEFEMKDETRSFPKLKSVSTSPVPEWLKAPSISELKFTDVDEKDRLTLNLMSESVNDDETPKYTVKSKYDYGIFDDYDNPQIQYHQRTSKKQANNTRIRADKKMLSANDGEYSCKFCDGKKFKSIAIWKVHMKNCHKKCNCPCGEYFETREDYLKHFYELFPLSCFIERKCPERFRSLYYQAVHHKDKHYSDTPFYCVLCHRDNSDLSPRRKVCFKDIKSLRIHAESLCHDPKSLFLISSVTEVDNSLLPWTMTCTGINFS